MRTFLVNVFYLQILPKAITLIVRVCVESGENEHNLDKFKHGCTYRKEACGRICLRSSLLALLSVAAAM